MYTPTRKIRETKAVELKRKERELEQLKEKIAKGEVSGNGAPQMVEDLTKEIAALKIKLGFSEL